MELAIPLSKFSASSVTYGSYRTGYLRRTIPFAYEENQISLSSLILVLQPMRVVEYDESRNHLVLEDVKKTSFFSKLETLQDHTQEALNRYKTEWLEGTALPREIYPVQPLIRNKRITLHLSSQRELMPYFVPPSASSARGGSAVEHSTVNGAKEELTASSLKPGDFVRAIVKLQGLSLQMSPEETWTGKSRIQHHVLQLFKVAMDA
jgi:hypothetical protein